MSTHPYGNNFRVTVTKYTDEDLDIVIDQLNLEIKSDKLIRQGGCTQWHFKYVPSRHLQLQY